MGIDDPTRNGSFWLWPDGTMLPVITGGDGDEDEDNGDDDSNTDDSKAGEDKPKTFTQADIDKIVKERLKRERAQFADYADVKKKAEEYDKLTAAQKSEVDKAVERAAQAEEKISKVQEKLRLKNLSLAVIAAAKELKIEDYETAQLYIERDGIDFDDDDEPIEIESKLKALLKKKPNLKAPKFEDGADGGPRDTLDEAKLSVEERIKRRAKEKQTSGFRW